MLWCPPVPSCAFGSSRDFSSESLESVRSLITSNLGLLFDYYLNYLKGTYCYFMYTFLTIILLQYKKCWSGIWLLISGRGMRLRKVSYKAFIFSVFSRNQGKTKPLTWQSVSSLLHSQAPPNLTASRHNLVAIQLYIKISFTWQFGNSNRCVWFSFTLGLHKWRDSDKCLKLATLIWNNGWPSGSSAAAFRSFKTASERPALCLFSSLRNSDVLTAKSALKSLVCPIAMSCRPRMLASCCCIQTPSSSP